MRRSSSSCTASQAGHQGGTEPGALPGASAAPHPHTRPQQAAPRRTTPAAPSPSAASSPDPSSATAQANGSADTPTSTPRTHTATTAPSTLAMASVPAPPTASSSPTPDPSAAVRSAWLEAWLAASRLSAVALPAVPAPSRAHHDSSSIPSTTAAPASANAAMASTDGMPGSLALAALARSLSSVRLAGSDTSSGDSPAWDGPAATAATADASDAGKMPMSARIALRTRSCRAWPTLKPDEPPRGRGRRPASGLAVPEKEPCSGDSDGPGSAARSLPAPEAPGLDWPPGLVDASSSASWAAVAAASCSTRPVSH
mmetsp:Transcript_3610/g.15006  ORF Transcript_3610/g.15006 Transcript_3610/m.15006 type:complete len:314 (+) Transcript_3610:512-1453(+)